MTDWRLSDLPPYAFPRLRQLLDGIAPGEPELSLAIGEPKHPMPSFVPGILADHASEYCKYPPNEGTPELRQSITDWLTRRYGLTSLSIDPETNIQPVNGTREGLFNIAVAIVPPDKNGARPIALLPNPFYQCYAAAAVNAGADPVYVPATKETGFLPDIASVSSEILERTSLVYICSPANPQGTVATADFWQNLIRLAQTFDFRIVSDECYSEIYDDKAPVGLLETLDDLIKDGQSDIDLLDRVIVFNSLSKRSNLPGLRSGFAAGSAPVLSRFRQLRSYGGAPLPLPVCAASTAAWADEDHVVANRALYRDKFRLAESIFETHLDYYTPGGGFFLWLNVGVIGETGETAAVKLWREAGIRVLPGKYLARDSEDGNPGENYIRVALVHDLPTLEKVLTRVNQILR